MHIEIPLISPNRRRLAPQRRQAVLIALFHRLAAVVDTQARSCVEDMCRHFSAMPPSARFELVLDPLVRICMRFTSLKLARDAKSEAIHESFDATSEFRRLFDECPRRTRTIRQGIGLIRGDPDSLLKLIAPPTYKFPEAPPASAYTLDFFTEVADVAIRRIESTWPVVGNQMHSYIRLLVHVPDGEFRSCSAARYSGLVFLTNADETLLDLEETLVHEWGHQVLYDAMELDPIVDDDGTRQFSLPWSGDARDLYGYFHAYYIYTILALYFARVLHGPQIYRRVDVQRARERGVEILKGLKLARPDFRNNARRSFTEFGRSIIKDLENSQNRISEALRA